MTDGIELKKVEDMTIGINNDGKVTANGLTADELAALALAELALKSSGKTGVWHEDNRNLLGGLIGVGIGVGLELLSPTGSKTSAVVAAAAGAGTLYAARRIMDMAPQNNHLAGACAASSMLISATAGRIAADYFPGNIEE